MISARLTILCLCASAATEVCDQSALIGPDLFYPVYGSDLYISILWSSLFHIQSMVQTFLYPVYGSDLYISTLWSRLFHIQSMVQTFLYPVYGPDLFYPVYGPDYFISSIWSRLFYIQSMVQTFISSIWSRPFYIQSMVQTFFYPLYGPIYFIYSLWSRPFYIQSMVQTFLYPVYGSDYFIYSLWSRPGKEDLIMPFSLQTPAVCKLKGIISTKRFQPSIKDLVKWPQVHSPDKVTWQNWGITFFFLLYFIFLQDYISPHHLTYM